MKYCDFMMILGIKKRVKWLWEKPSKNGLVENLILIIDQLKSCDLDAYSARKPQKNTFKCNTFVDFQLKTAISQSGIKQITWFL